MYINLFLLVALLILCYSSSIDVKESSAQESLIPLTENVPTYAPTVLTTKLLTFTTDITISGATIVRRRATAVGETTLRTAATVAISLSDSDKQALQETLAEILEVNANEVSFVSANEDTSTSSITAKLSCTINFVDYPAYIGSESNFYNKLKGAITSVSNSDFNSKLKTKANALSSATFDSSSLSSVTVYAAVYSYPSGTAIKGSYSDDDPKKEAIKAGEISIGVLLGVIMLILATYCICLHGRGGSSSAKVDDGNIQVGVVSKV